MATKIAIEIWEAHKVVEVSIFDSIIPNEDRKSKANDKGYDPKHIGALARHSRRIKAFILGIC